MATLTITHVVRTQLGNKAFRVSKCVIGVLAEGSLTVTAGSLDLNSIEMAFAFPGTVGSLDLADFQLSTTSGQFIDMNVTSGEVNDIFYIWAFGN